MQFFKKMITLRINLFAFIMALLLLGTTSVAIYFQLPEALFFKLLSPSQIHSVELRLSRKEGYTQLTQQEISDLIHILNQVNVKEKRDRCFTPSEQSRADYRIHLKWGTTLHVSTQSGPLAINAHIYNSPQLADSLYELARQQREARATQ